MILNAAIRRASGALPPVQDFSMVRGDVKSFPVRCRQVPTGRTVAAIYWTAKASASDPDSAIVLQKSVTVVSAAGPVATGTLDFAEADTTDAGVVPATIAWDLVAALDNGDAYSILSGTTTFAARIPVTLVTDTVPATVIVSPSAPTIAEPGTQQFTAIVKNAAEQTIVGATVTWSVFAGGSAASIDSGGLATGLSGGTATIRATSGSVHGDATLTVMSTDPTDATLQVIYAGDSLNVTPATVSQQMPYKATALLGDGTITYLNTGVSGRSITDVIAAQASEINGYLDQRKTIVAVVTCGTNDWALYDTATVLGYDAQYVAALYAIGIDRVVFATTPARRGAPNDAERLAVNAARLTNAGGIYGDAIADVAGIIGWNVAATFDVVANTDDGVHPNNPGTTQEAVPIAAAILGAFAMGKRSGNKPLDHAVLTLPTGATAGGSGTATAAGFAVDDTEITIGITKQYGSSQPAVATINATTGALTYVSEGSTLISVTITQGVIQRTDNDTLVVAAGGSSLASRLADMVTATGGNSDVAGIYHTGIAGRVTDDGDGSSSSVADARGTSGFGPALTATGGDRALWDAVNKLLKGGADGGVGSNKHLRSAPFAGFRRNLPHSIAMVFESLAGNPDQFLCGLTTNGALTDGYTTLKSNVGSNISAPTSGGTVNSDVPASTTRRLALVTVSATQIHVKVMGHAKVLVNTTSALGDGTHGDQTLQLFGYDDTHSAAVAGNFLCFWKHELTDAEITAVETFAAADCGAVAAP